MDIPRSLPVLYECMLCIVCCTVLFLLGTAYVVVPVVRINLLSKHGDAWEDKAQTWQKASTTSTNLNTEHCRLEH